jgi:serine/threonine-protein kinase
VVGAGRLAAFFLSAWVLEWLCTAHHVSRFDELGQFVLGAIEAGALAVLVWMQYVALEPCVRRRWPQSIVSWSRLLGGGIRDPLVGGHLLIGIAFGVGVASLFLVRGLLIAHYGSFTSSGIVLDSVLDMRRTVGAFIILLLGGAGNSLFFFLELFLLRVLLRRQWLAAATLIFLTAGPYLANDHPVIETSLWAILCGLAIFTLIRFGVLSMAIAPAVTYALTRSPLSTNFSTWYAGSAVFALAAVLALTAYAFHTALASRPLFTASFLERD